MNNGIEPVNFSVLEAAKYLGMSRNRVYDLCKTEDFPVFSVNRRKFIPKQKLDEWINDSVGKTIVL